jgi:hypothetical protein
MPLVLNMVKVSMMGCAGDCAVSVRYYPNGGGGDVNDGLMFCDVEVVVAFDRGDLVIYLIVLSHTCERSYWSYESRVYDNGDYGVEFYHRPR